MTAEFLFDCIGNISDTYISEADEAAIARRTPPFRMWRPALAAAACIVVAAAAMVSLYAQQKGINYAAGYGFSAGTDGAADALAPDNATTADPPEAPEASAEADKSVTEESLPRLPAELNSGGMGFEGVMAYNIDELTNANPWTEEAAFATLPVYQNTMSYYPSGAAISPDLESMRATAVDVAQRLGIPEQELTISDNGATEEEIAALKERLALTSMDPDSEIYRDTLLANTQADRITAQNKAVSIEVESNCTAYVTFSDPIPLGKGMSYYHYSPLSAVQEAGSYLLAQPIVTGFLERPVLNISGGAYNIYAEQSYSIEYFEEGDMAEEQLLNYNFNTLQIYGSESGSVTSMRLHHHDLSEKLGDYPIISADTARELLLNGNYITTVPEEMPGEEYIRKVELIYRSSPRDEVWMPYYRFYVELESEKMDNGLNTYGAYYVPAVEERYLTSLPVWDGGFN